MGPRQMFTKIHPRITQIKEQKAQSRCPAVCLLPPAYCPEGHFKSASIDVTAIG